MINTNKLDAVIAGYKEYFPTHWKNEKYKWQAIKHFQDNWDLDASDFADMLQRSLAKTENLLASLNNFPARMIIVYAKMYPEEVKEAFRELFDESSDFSDRINSFKAHADDWLKRTPDNAKQHYQNEYSITIYLWLRYPDKYYIYKFSEAKEVAQELESSYIIKKGKSEANAVSAFELYNEIRAVLQTDEAIKQMLAEALTDDCYLDPELVTLTIDVGFYVSRFYNKDESDDSYETNDNTDTEDSLNLATDDKRRYWLYAPGHNASRWDQFYKEGIMAIGWDELGDLREYKNKKQIKEELKKSNGETSNYMNDAHATWQFVNEVKQGDIIFVKKGTSLVIGCGIVSSDYIFDDSRKEYKNIRMVDWTHKGEWQHPGKAVLKTLTDITQYKEYVQKLLDLVKVDDTSSDDVDLDTDADRPIYTYEMIKSFHSNQRNIKWFKPLVDAIRELGGSASRPMVHKKIIEMCKITDDELDKKNKSGFSQILNDIDWARNYLTYEGILDGNAPNGSWVLSSLGKKIKMTQDLAEKIIIKWIKIKTAEREKKPIPIIDLTPVYSFKIAEYTKSDFLKDVFVTEQQYDTLSALLENKMNIILQGAPGVGKTFAARRLAWSLMGEKDDSRIEFIQFHQSYSYEDFIMGYRPKDDGGFTLKEGVFYRFCDKARTDKDRKYFFIIDEINRGNLSKIFGELLMLIEKDYRNETATLAYRDESFSVPDNLYIIGMMNTADRSLAMIDYALRRRFSFFDMTPGFDSKGFKDYHSGLKNKTFDSLIDMVKLLNDAISNDSSLGKGFCIGHSHFCNLTAKECTVDRLRSIVDYDIIPMLSEYWFDDKDSLKTWTDKLRGVFND